jgi:hypothetical protein
VGRAKVPKRNCIIRIPRPRNRQPGDEPILLLLDELDEVDDEQTKKKQYGTNILFVAKEM